MGSNKALLPFRGSTLLEHIAQTVHAAAGSVILVGQPEIYSHLSLPVVADARPECGPLGGIETCLAATDADWSLVVACDMPEVSAAFLHTLFEAAETGGGDALVPAGPSGRPEPLCAVYHHRSLPVVRHSLDRGVRKVMDGLSGLSVRFWNVPDESLFRNVNSPQEWTSYALG
jgi:molybdopterin-guanine dinucleotide biosynthesis protein A